MRSFKIIIVFSILFVLNSCGYFHKSDRNIKESAYLYIPKGATYQMVLDSLKPHLKDLNGFDSYAQFKDYDREIKPGRYKITPNLTNEQLVKKLMKGQQDEVKIRIPNSPTLFHLAKTASRGIIADSAGIVRAILNAPRIKADSLNIETAKIYFIPNTYNFRWLTDSENFVDRILKEHDKFWNEKRKILLKQSKMSELEVYTLASIVQMESSKPDEQPKVAAVYLNRLKNGMKLQADPTVVYSYKLKNGFNKKVQRVYEKDLQMASAYNTYLNFGLPPAPICLPNPSAIDAVLTPDENDYIYFCANPDKPGYHTFTKSYAEHLKNAEKYRAWLKQNDIK